MPSKLRVNQLEDLEGTVTHNVSELISDIDSAIITTSTGEQTLVDALDSRANSEDVVRIDELGDTETQIPVGSSPRTVNERFSDLVTVQDFGAVGDGVTDDTPAFEAAISYGGAVHVPPGAYYLTTSFSQRNWTAASDGVTFTNGTNRITEFGFNITGVTGVPGAISQTFTPGRDELKIYQGNGAQMLLYGNNDQQHAGNIALITGEVGLATARMIVSGYGAEPGSDGERYNDDTRVTIGDNIWNYVDDRNDDCLLNLISNGTKPAIKLHSGNALSRTISTASDGGIYFAYWNGTTAEDYFAASGSSLIPGADNDRSLGSSGRRWSQVYAGTATISTSDSREKTEVRPFTQSEIEAAKLLSKEIGFFKFLNQVEAKGDSAREHCGMTVQKAIEIMEDNGLDPFNYGFICYDSWEDDKETGVKAGDRYSFRETELHSFILRGMEARLSSLEE